VHAEKVDITGGRKRAQGKKRIRSRHEEPNYLVDGWGLSFLSLVNFEAYGTFRGKGKKGKGGEERGGSGKSKANL